MARARTGIIAGALALVLGSACDDDTGRGGAAPDGTQECTGSKCDVPTGAGEDLCAGRRAVAFTDGKEGFTPTALRWSCSDVPGVTQADRGQEYCEYWAVASFGGDAHELGRQLDQGTRETPSKLELSGDELDYLEQADPDAVVGACVFSSWNKDKEASCSGCEDLHGLPVDAEHFRAVKPLNSFGAAVDLAVKCTSGGHDASTEDTFSAGCLYAHDLFTTGWRKSDSTICAASVALAECNCQVPGGARTLALPEEPGFPLASWDSEDEPPPGCRYVPVGGDDTRVLVACDITAETVKYEGADLRQWCRDTFAERVVVHVPIPADAIQCDPSCGATPWVLHGDG